MKCLPLCLAGALAAVTAANCLAFDPAARFVTRRTGAGTRQIPYFTEGNVKYTLNLPYDTVVSQDSGETTFLFNQLEGSTLVLKASPLSPSVAFSRVEDYGKQALSTLTAGAEEAAPRAGTVSLALPGAAASLAFAYDYKLPGRRFAQAVSFMNWGGSQQMMLIVTAPAGSFEKALAISAEMLRSWRTMAPGEDLSEIPAL